MEGINIDVERDGFLFEVGMIINQKSPESECRGS